MQRIIFVLLACLLPIGAWADDVERSSTEVVCGDFFVCLTGAELEQLRGKTITYKHPRSAQEFGEVEITFRENGWVAGRNKKGGSSGTWVVKGNVINIKFTQWGTEVNVALVRIHNRMFVQPSVDQTPALLPVKITD